jgi:transcriptional regulator with XRE-family HTH domain
MAKRLIEDIYGLIGKRIRELRLAREPKMSQQTLAKHVGLSRVSIVNIENGRHRIQIHQLIELARALGVLPQEFFPAASPKPTSLPQGFVEALKPKERTAVEQLLASKRGSDA